MRYDIKNYVKWFSIHLLGCIILLNPFIGVCENNEGTTKKEYQKFSGTWKGTINSRKELSNSIVSLSLTLKVHSVNYVNVSFTIIKFKNGVLIDSVYYKSHCVSQSVLELIVPAEFFSEIDGKRVLQLAYKNFDGEEMLIGSWLNDTDESVIAFKKINLSDKVAAAKVEKRAIISNRVRFSSRDTGLISSGNIVHMADNIISLDVDQLYPFYNGYAVIEKGQSFALINASGEIVVPFNKYVFNFKGNSDYGFSGGTCAVMDVNTKKWGMINSKLELFIPCIYTHVQPVDNNGRIWVGKEGEASSNDQYILDIKGKLIANVNTIANNFQSKGIGRVFTFQPEGNLVLCYKPVKTASGTKNKYGFTNLNGTYIIIPFEYDEAWPFSEGMSVVGKRDEYGILKYGFINTLNKLVIPFKFSKRPGRFVNGRACVEPLDKSEFTYGYIDTHGEVIIKIKSDGNCSDNLIRGGMGSEMPIDMYTLSDFKNGYSFWSRYCRNDKKSSGLVVMDTLGNMNLYNSLLLKNEWNEGYIPQGNFVHNEVLLNSVGNRTNAIADIHGNILIKTLENTNLSSYIRTTFEPVSNLAVITVMKQNVGFSGYVNRKGEIVILKSPGGKW